MKRRWPGLPRDGFTVHHLSDAHIGYAPWSADVLDGATDDFTAALIDHVRVVVHTGDMTDDGGQASGEGGAPAGTEQDRIALSWLTRSACGKPDLWCTGNHDLRDRVPNTRAAWEAVYGRDANTFVDVGEWRFIALSPDACGKGTSPEGGDPWTIPRSTLDWVDATITAHSGPVMLCCHYPPEEFGTQYVEPAPGITDLVSSHPNVYGYLTGHMHWWVGDTRHARTVRMGNRRNFPVVLSPSQGLSTGGVHTPDLGYDEAARYPVWSMYHTLYDDRWEIRYRCHGRRMWSGPPGFALTTLNLSTGAVRNER